VPVLLALATALVPAFVLVEYFKVPAHSSWFLFWWVVGYLVLYFLSLLLKPYTICPRCNGNTRHYGILFRRAFSFCPRCGGSGRVVRWGRRTFFSSPEA
jgi:hypothetical protein